MQVTIFPVKLAKKGPRLESVAVCIVERSRGGGGGGGKEEKEYLLVRRPHTGLLAGLWEAPSVVLESKESKEEGEENEDGEAEEPKRNKKVKRAKESTTEITEEGMREKMDEYLHKEVKMSGYKVQGRMWVGEVVHIFSHIKQTLRVECIFYLS